MRIMKKSYYQYFLKTRVWFLILIVIAPAIFAAPLPISWRPFHYLSTPIQVVLSNGEPQEKTKSQIPNRIEAFGESLFSSLLGIETESMPTYVDMSNTSNVIYLNGVVDPQIFLNDGGLADIYVSLSQDGKDSLMKIPLASSTHRLIDAENEAGLGNEITWQAKPTEKLVNVIFSLSGKLGFEFKWQIYLKNYLILLGGWVILLASLIQVLQFFKKDSDDAYFMDGTDKKILKYLTEKNKASEGAVINETFQELGVSKEEYIDRLKILQIKDFIRYERPFGNGAFIYITENGRYALEPFPYKVWGYITHHFLEILIFLATVLTLWATLR